MKEDNENVAEEDEEEDVTPEDLLDDEEKDLLEQLMERVESAGILDDELSTDFTSFSERVDEVMDSVERIENIEKSQMEKAIFQKEKEGTEGGKVEPEGDQIPEPETMVGMEEGQIYIVSDTPYEEVADGQYHPDEEADLISYYGSEAADILKNIYKLINIKLSKDEMDEATNLFELAKSIGGNTEEFNKMFNIIMKKLGLEPAVSGIEGEPELEEKETQVLDPDLAEGIDILEKRSRGAIEQLKHMMMNSYLTEENMDKVRDLSQEATDLFREKRFHRAHQVAISGLEMIRNQVQDSLENKIQENLFRSREMLEGLQKDDKLDDLNILSELKSGLDMAEKAYLTNEYEKANLLSKKVMAKIFDITEPDGVETKEKLREFRGELDKLREKNILHEDIADIGNILKSAENLFKRRDIANARKLSEQISVDLEDLKVKAKTYIEAKELEIKLNNRLPRLETSGHNLTDVKKKIGFMREYLKTGRFEDVIVIGNDLEKEIDSLETIKEEIESKSIFEELELLMANSNELEDHEIFQNKFIKLKESYMSGEFEIVKEEGEPLLQELRIRTKTLNVERVRRIANGIIESKVLMSKMKSLNLDSTPYERKLRTIKNLLKDGSRSEGLKQLDKVIHDMKKEVRDITERMKKMTTIYRDSLEVVMDRHKDQSIIFHIKNRHIPIIRKMEELGKYKSAIENYYKMGDKFADLNLPEDRISMIETELTECKFEIYKRKEQGLDISEPLNLYTTAQKKFSSGEIVPAEFLVEVSKRYCEEIIPLAA